MGTGTGMISWLARWFLSGRFHVVCSLHMVIVVTSYAGFLVDVPPFLTVGFLKWKTLQTDPCSRSESGSSSLLGP